MPDDDEIAADLLDLIDRMVVEGDLELATRRDGAALAGELLPVIRSYPDMDLAEWLIEQVQVNELFLDAHELANRAAPIVHRIQHGDPEPRWNDELAARIRAAPEDSTPWLVFADWLEQAGDPRGELMAVQARLIDAAEDEELRRSEALLLQRFKTYLFGSLPEDSFHGTWRFGFLDELEVDAASLERMLTHPSLRFLRGLRLSGPISSIEALTASKPLPSTLAQLSIRVVREPGVLQLAPLLRGLDRLETLEVSATDVAFEPEALSLSRLRSLSFAKLCPTFTHSNKPDLWPSALPALEELAIEAWTEVDASTQQAFWYLVASPPPKLRVLHLHGWKAVEWVQRLLGSPLLAQLDTLDLSRSRDATGLAALLGANTGQLSHLKVLDLQHIELEDRSALASLGARVVMTPPPPATDVDQDGNEPDRGPRDRNEDEDEDEDDEDDEGEDELQNAFYDDVTADPNYVPDEEVEEPDEDQDQVVPGVDSDAPVEERFEEPE